MIDQNHRFYKKIMDSFLYRLLNKIYRKFFAKSRFGLMLYLIAYNNNHTLNFPSLGSYDLCDNLAEKCNDSTGISLNSKYPHLYNVKNCTVFSASQFVITRDKKNAFFLQGSPLDLKDKYKKYFFQEEVKNKDEYNPLTKQIKITNRNLKIDLYGDWFSLLAPNNFNWMHWISEHLPKIARLEDEIGNEFSFGVIIDTVPTTVIDSLRVTSGNRPIVQIPPDSEVRIENLLVLNNDMTQHAAFWSRQDVTLTGEYYFDAVGLKLLRKKIFNSFNIKDIEHIKHIESMQCQNIFIQRNSLFRFLLNQQDVKSMLELTYGFKTLSPEELSFQTQVQQFSKTALLVCQASSVLANMIFMPAGATVICLAANNQYINCNYFSDYADIFSIRLIYLLCEVDNPESYDSSAYFMANHPVNANFVCSLDKLSNLLNVTINKRNNADIKNTMYA